MELKKYLESRYTKQTAKAYYREIENYLLNYTMAETALHRDIVGYIGTLRKRYSNSKTIGRILASIKTYYDFLNTSGKRKDNPAKSIRLRDKQSRDIQLQDLFSAEELESLLNQKTERYNALSYRNKVLISLFIYQALKPTEIALLSIEDINLEQGTIYIKPTAKCNSRTLPLKVNQILLFHQYIYEIRAKLLKNGLNDYFIIGHRSVPMSAEDITKHVKRAYKGVFETRNVNAQTIRQSVISNLLKQNNDLRIVQVFAGHKYPSTTERYKQTSVEALKTAIQIHHPIK